MAIPKKDGKFRIFGDYQVTDNGTTDAYQYPLQKPTELLATLAGGQTFIKLGSLTSIPAVIIR